MGHPLLEHPTPTLLTPSQLPSAPLFIPHGKVWAQQVPHTSDYGTKVPARQELGDRGTPGEPASGRVWGNCLPRSCLLISAGDLLRCCGWI